MMRLSADVGVPTRTHTPRAYYANDASFERESANRKIVSNRIRRYHDTHSNV